MNSELNMRSLIASSGPYLEAVLAGILYPWARGEPILNRTVSLRPLLKQVGIKDGRGR